MEYGQGSLEIMGGIEYAKLIILQGEARFSYRTYWL